MTSMQDHFETAVQTLEDHIDDQTGFLWTGGSDAQVVADLLVNHVEGGEDVPFLTIDTGNPMASVAEFRREYADDHDFEWHVRRYDTMLNEVIQNPKDPRGYHGHWDEDTELPDVERAGFPRSRAEWGVAESCGVLKTVPLRRFIEEDGYTTLLTGQRADDPFAPSSEGVESRVVEKRQPAPHTRVMPLYDWQEEQTWAYIKREFVPYPDAYDEGYHHTDAGCCVDADAQVGEYGEGGRDPEKMAARDGLEEMGYI